MMDMGPIRVLYSDWKEGTFLNYTHQLETMATSLEDSAALCDSLTDAQDNLARELMDKVVGKWALWVLSVLAGSPAPMRFTRVLEQVEGVSQKVLTQTLRQLERDGLVSRKLFAQVPPRVEYALTPLGHDLLAQVMPVWTWIAGNIGRFEQARTRFDAPKPDLQAAE